MGIQKTSEKLIHFLESRKMHYMDGGVSLSPRQYFEKIRVQYGQPYAKELFCRLINQIVDLEQETPQEEKKDDSKFEKI